MEMLILDLDMDLTDGLDARGLEASGLQVRGLEAGGLTTRGTDF